MTPIDPILVLRVVTFDGQPVAEPIMCQFGQAGGTIGRATDCTLALPDPQRSISRVQARIEIREGTYMLCDQGGNPSQLNGSAIGGTREVRLNQGDKLTVGAYQIDVLITEKSSPLLHDTLTTAQVLGGPLGTGTSYTDTLDALGQQGFGTPKPVSTQPRFQGSVSDHVAAEFQAFSVPQMSAPPAATMPGFGAPVAPAPAAAPAGGGIPAHYDPLEDIFAQWETPGAAPGASPFGAPSHAAAPMTPAPSFAPLSPAPMAPAPAFAPMSPAPSFAPAAPAHAGPTGLASSLLDDPKPGEGGLFGDLFAPASASTSAAPTMPDAAFDPLASLSPAMPAGGNGAHAARAAAPAAPAAFFDPLAPVAAPAPQAGASAGFFDPLAPMAAPAPAATPAFAPLEPAGLGAIAAPAAMPAPVPMPAPVAAPAPAAKPAAPAAPVSAADASVVAALMAGLGLEGDRAPNLPPADLARMTGSMLREALRGTMAVLRSRSMTKREARLDTTVIVARDNNPLKFFPDVDSALAQMLTGRAAGYLPPDQALEHAFADIEAHGLAVIAGMRAALTGVLARFDPAALEAELEEPGMIDKLLSNRKARLWDAFVEQKARIASESEDDFQQLFGRAFNEAYEAQVDALLNARKHGGNT